MLAPPSADFLVSCNTLAGILLCRSPLPAVHVVEEYEVFPTPSLLGFG